MNIAKALTIAGSDSGGGAGIQADLKTFQELKVYGMSAITAVTAQNTLGVHGVYPIETKAVIEQIKAITSDLKPAATKTGMLFNTEIIEAVADISNEEKWEKLVVDPVMIAKGGASLLQNEAMEALKTKLIPVAFCITPNIPEAECIVGYSINSLDDRKKAALDIYQMGVQNVVIKGGHDTDDVVVDLLFNGKQYIEFPSQRIYTMHTHGTGCTFSAAITAELAKGEGIENAISIAKEFIHAAIKYELGIGSGHGPTNHWAYNQQGVFTL